MSNRHQPQTTFWANAIIEAYASKTRPPIASDQCLDLIHNFADELAKAEASGTPKSSWGNFINPLLDEWERATGVVGPRFSSIDEAIDAVHMVERSQADHPLRPFGGQ